MKNQKTIIEIIKKYLINNEFDGLYNEDYECACEMNDLEPCGQLQSDCKTGYKHPGDSEYDFYIKDRKYVEVNNHDRKNI